MFTKKNKNSGTTLVELMAVIGVIGIISAISIAFIRQYQPNLLLFTSSRELKNIINSAREKTISEQIQYGVKIFPDQNAYDFIRTDSPSTPISSHNLPQGIIIKSISEFQDNIIKFNKAGASEEPGLIILENMYENEKTIIINPSGYVKSE